GGYGVCCTKCYLRSQMLRSARARLVDVGFQRVDAEHTRGEIGVPPYQPTIATTDLEDVLVTEVDEIVNGARLVALVIDRVCHLGRALPILVSVEAILERVDSRVLLLNYSIE